MKLFKVCLKCKARYLLFHLASDCEYVSKNFELVKAAAQKDAIDWQLSQKKQVNLFSICAKIVRENLDEESSILEWGRFSSFLFLFFLFDFIVGISSLFVKDIFGIPAFLGIVGIVGYFLWAIFLVQGGFNYIFKMLIMFDILRRYKIE